MALSVTIRRLQTVEAKDTQGRGSGKVLRVVQLRIENGNAAGVEGLPGFLWGYRESAELA